jgi:hypothetical protein
MQTQSPDNQTIDRDLKLKVYFENRIEQLTGIKSGSEICLRNIRAARIKARKENPVDAVDKNTCSRNNERLQELNSAIDSIEKAL